MANTNTENTRKGRDHYSHAKLDARWAKLRIDAEDRQEAHNKLTINQKIAKAKSRRGESKREIARLEKQLAEQKLTPVVVKTEANSVVKKTKTTKKLPKKTDVVK